MPPVFECPPRNISSCSFNNEYGVGRNIALHLRHRGLSLRSEPDICFESTELEKMTGFIKSYPAIGQFMLWAAYPDGSLQYLCKLLLTPAGLFLRRFAAL
jgi:hypothetical protein